MFSGTSGRKAQQKSAAARRKRGDKGRERRALDDAAEQQEAVLQQIDVRARIDFLRAADEVFEPSPLSTLREIRPTFQIWLDSVAPRPAQCSAPVAGLRIERCCPAHEFWRQQVLALFGSAQPLPAGLSERLESWARRYGFHDEWVTDAALLTLGFAATDGTFEWTLSPPSGSYLEPSFQFAMPGWQRQESLEDFRRRAKERFQREMKAYVGVVQARTGERKLQDRQPVWTAHRFAGETYPQIADWDATDDEVVRKGVDAFARRAGLSLPKTKVVFDVLGSP